jgi:thiol-disulfide isomerase/thioredoxin
MRKLLIAFTFAFPLLCFAQDEVKKFEIKSPGNVSGREYMQWWEHIQDSLRTYMIGKKAPLFTRTSIDSQSLDLEALKGKVVVLNFWYISCAPCRAEMPYLDKLAKEYKGKDVVFISFCSDVDAPIKEFLSKKPFAYTVMPTSKPQEIDYNISSFPTNIVIDKKGVIREYKMGAYAGKMNKLLIRELGDVIDKYLGE